MIKAARHPGWTFAVDYGPLLIFFLVYKVAGVFVGTAAFMLAIAVAVLVSRAKLGRVSPMLWLSAILVVSFGGLTLWFHDPRFIQRKPTIIYVMLSALLFAGLAMRRPLLKYVLEAGFDGLSERGWMILSRNWAFYFAALAVLNEVLVRTVSFDTWLAVKVWGVTALSFLFALAQAPVLMKHGLGEEDPGG